jgi:gas vesicle protein
VRARKFLTGVAIGALSAVVALLFRRMTSRRDRAEIYFGTGSVVSLTGDDAEPLARHARDVLLAGRG